MRTEQMLAAKRPAPDASVNPTLRVFQSGELVLTGSGTVPVERLRPGDRVVMDAPEPGNTVQWVEMRRSASTGKIRIQVMFGPNPSRRKAQTALPVRGCVSSKTGRLEFASDDASARDASKPIH